MTRAEQLPSAGPGIDLERIPTWDGALVQVVIETPKHAPTKLKFDPKLGAFRLSKILPVGMVFPFDFGFAPGTKAADGDPLDVLVLMEAPVYPGCVVPARPIGVLVCEQGDARRRAERNDRVLAVADASPTYRAIRSIDDLGPTLLAALETFFTDYQRLSGRTFRVLRRQGAAAARQAIKRSQAAARRADSAA